MATQTAPAATSAPAPSAPEPSAPSGSGGGDWEQNLRNDTIAWGHNPNGTPDTPSESTTTDPAAGSTPAAPEQAQAAGSTLPTEGQPATTDAPTSSDHDSWVKRYGDPDKAAKEAFALESRAADMAKRIKELEAAHPSPAPSPQATAPAAQPAQPAPTAAPAAAQPQATTIPQTTDELVQFALTNDDKCRELLTQYNANEAQLRALIDTEIPTLQNEIWRADVLLAHPQADELMKDEARQNKQRAELTLAAREARQSSLELTNQKLDLQFGQRINGHASRLQQQAESRTREADIAQGAEAKATEFIGHWPTAFDAEFKAQGLDPEMRADIYEAVKVQALARPGLIDLKDLPAFMKDAVKAEFNKVDKYHRLQARQHALRKNADTNPAAPTGLAATATEVSAPVSTEDHLDALRRMTREAYRSKGGRS